MDWDSFSLTRKSIVILAATWWVASGYQKSSCRDEFNVSHSELFTQHIFLKKHMCHILQKEFGVQCGYGMDPSLNKLMRMCKYTVEY